jgi:hypothetical protein
MNKAQLKRHAEQLTEAYVSLSAIWADIGVMKVALDAEKIPPSWMIKEILERDWDIMGDALLSITEFTDAMIEDNKK